MNPSTQRLRKLELCLIPDAAVAYLTAQSHEERHKQFLSLTSYFKEYNSLIQSQQTDRQGTNRVTKALCVSGVLDSHTPFADTYSQQTKPLCEDYHASDRVVRQLNTVELKTGQSKFQSPIVEDKTADTYSQNDIDEGRIKVSECLATQQLVNIKPNDKQDRSRSNKPYRNDALDRSPVLSLDRIRNYQDGVVA